MHLKIILLEVYIATKCDAMYIFYGMSEYYARSFGQVYQTWIPNVWIDIDDSLKIAKKNILRYFIKRIIKSKNIL